MTHKFRIAVLNGMDEVTVEGDSVRVYAEDGSYLELHPRRSDGEINLYAKDKLVLYPEATNCARVESKRRQ